MLQAKLVWREAWSFEAHSGTGHKVAVDGKKESGASPMELLIIGMAGCTTVDVVSIMEKMREDVHALEVEIEADQREEHPKYITTIRMNYLVKGKQIKEENLKRAIELSHERYCSALHSLRPDINFVTNYQIEEA